MTGERQKIDQFSADRRRAVLDERMKQVIEPEKRDAILNFGSQVKELDLMYEDEALLLIAVMARQLDAVALDMSRLSLSFMLEVTGRAAEYELEKLLRT
jgi:hypothetical protein